MKLSVCIATIPERAEQFRALVDFLEVESYKEVELVTDDRPRGSISIGAKRQALNEKATGDYVVHLDDDDWVAYGYIGIILEALKSSPDCVGHFELVEGLSPIPQISKWTNKAIRWEDGQRTRQRHGVDYLRTPFHKTPLKRSHALAVGFNDMGLGEDHDFSKRLQAAQLCRVEVFIPRVLYFYRTDNIPKQYQ
jgi:hypothetical protein